MSNYFGTENHAAMLHVVQVITRNATEWPKKVTGLIEKHQGIYQAVNNLSSPKPPAPQDWTVSGLEDLSGEIALEYAIEEHRRSALALISREVDRELRTALINNWPGVHAKLAERFAKHAETYTTAVELIPATADHQDINTSSPKVIQSYSDARLAASELGTLVQTMRAIEGGLRLSDGGKAPRALDVSVPESLAQAGRISNGKPSGLPYEKEVPGAVRLLDPVMFCAVKEGAPLALQNYTERRRLFESYSDDPNTGVVRPKPGSWKRVI